MNLAVALTVLVSLLIINSGAPLFKGSLARNRFYGFRTRKTLSTDQLWYPANKRCGRDLIMAGVFLFVTAMGLIIWNNDQSRWIAIGLMIVTLLLVLLDSFLYVGRLSTDRKAS